jgi:hypothetical protein
VLSKEDEIHKQQAHYSVNGPFHMVNFFLSFSINDFITNDIFYE